MELNTPDQTDSPASDTKTATEIADQLPRLELYFATNKQATLEEIRLERRGGNHVAHLVRGGGANIPGKTGDFKWTSAVRGLAVLFLRHTAIPDAGASSI